MQITKQSRSYVDKNNIEKLISDILYKEGYKVKSISFYIIPEKDKKTTVTYSKNTTFYGAKVEAEEINAISQSKTLVKVNDFVDIKIKDDEILSLIKEHLVSEGYQIIESPYFHFETKYSEDGPYCSGYEEFKGVKCLTNKEVKNISIAKEN